MKKKISNQTQKNLVKLTRAAITKDFFPDI